MLCAFWFVLFRGRKVPKQGFYQRRRFELAYIFQSQCFLVSVFSYIFLQKVLHQPWKWVLSLFFFQNDSSLLVVWPLSTCPGLFCASAATSHNLPLCHSQWDLVRLIQLPVEVQEKACSCRNVLAKLVKCLHLYVFWSFLTRKVSSFLKKFATWFCDKKKNLWGAELHAMIRPCSCHVPLSFRFSFTVLSYLFKNKQKVSAFGASYLTSNAIHNIENLKLRIKYTSNTTVSHEYKHVFNI